MSFTLPGFPFFFLDFFFSPDPSLLIVANVVEFMRCVTLIFTLSSPAGNWKQAILVIGRIYRGDRLSVWDELG